MEKTIEITILHTNDMHGRLEAMARLTTFVRQQRMELEKAGRQVLYVDCGDAADRSLRFCGVTKGSVYPPILGAMGVQMQCLGNDISITYGPPAASIMAQNSPFPVLAANFFRDRKPLLAGFQPTQTWPISDTISIGMLGLTVNMQDFYALFDFPIVDFVYSAEEWYADLKTKIKGPFIVISHLGLADDHTLARVLPNVDVIVGGHTHNLLPEGEWEGNVLIAQAGQYAEHLGRVDLSIDAQSGEVLSKTARVIPVPQDLIPDPAVLAAIESAKAAAEEWMSAPVGLLADDLGVEYFDECPLGYLAADALREHMDAEVAIVSTGLFQKALPAGVLTLGELDSACFTTANPQLSLISGTEILTALEKGLDSDYVQKHIRAFRGTPIGFPAISGLEVHYNPQSKPRIQAVWVNGEALDPNRQYRIAHTDAEVRGPNFDAGYFFLNDEQYLKIEVPTILREVIADYLQRNTPTPAPNLQRLVNTAVHAGG